MYNHKKEMKKTLVGIVSGIALFGVMAVPAFAISTTAGLGHSAVANSASRGKGASIVHYKTSYTDPLFGPVQCAGVHQTGRMFSVNGQDSFTCTSTTGSPLTKVTPNESLSLATVGAWQSDSTTATLLAVSFTGVVSSDGFSYTAVAVY